jgi:CheY-like chemotaxis protein
VVSDIDMPVMDGVEFAQRFRALFPAVPILFTTGSPDRYPAQSISQCALLEKPFGRDRFLATVRRLLAEPHHADRPAAGQ